MKSLARTLITVVCAALSATTGLHAIADGISGSGIVKYFHSVVIDGVHYQTDKAIIRVNGEPALEADLKVGYHVSYRADEATLEAWSMDYYDTVAGPIDSVKITDPDMQGASIRVLGQTIETDADTWFHGASLDSLSPGMLVAISAEWLPNGKLIASSVDTVARTTNVLSGPISAIQNGGFTIGGVSVDASNIGLEVNGVSLADGEWVHALGFFDGATLHADRLVRMADRSVKALPATMEGALRREDGRWKLRDMVLALRDESKLLPGLRATVSGVLNPDGTLEAEDVRMEGKRRYRLDGVIESVQGNGDALMIEGRQVLMDERTSLRDDRDGYRWLGPENLGAHDSVSLIVEDVDGELRARKITRTSSLQAVVRAEVTDMHWWRGPKLLKKRQAAAFDALSARYDGKRVSAWRLRFLLKAGDEMTLRYDARGRVASAEVVSEREESDDDYSDED